MAFTPVPLATTADGTRQLPSFLAVDTSSNAWSLTPTVVSSVTYLDELIITAIGTQVTDNRKDGIDAIVTAASLAGAFTSAQTPDCATDVVAFKPFLSQGVRGPRIRSTVLLCARQFRNLTTAPFPPTMGDPSSATPLFSR